MHEGARRQVASWFDAQAASCAGLGSPLYAALLPEIGADVLSGHYDETLSPFDNWRFGDALPLRLAGAAHALALGGQAPQLAAGFPSCGGTVGAPVPARALADGVRECLQAHPEHIGDYLHRSVQTNETGRAAGLVLGLSALASMALEVPISLVEVGTSAGLNLRLDQFAYLDDTELLGGDASSPVRLAPRWLPAPPRLSPWVVADRVGLDPHPADPSEDAVALRLRSYLWPDQVERRARLDGAIELAGAVPARLIATDDTAASLRTVLAERAGHHPTLVFQSIMWQYVPTAARWEITRTIEEAGEGATTEAPLMRLTFEPDEFRRDRVAVQARRWPGGSGSLLAHADYHGRWVQALPASGP